MKNKKLLWITLGTVAIAGTALFFILQARRKKLAAEKAAADAASAQPEQVEPGAVGVASVNTGASAGNGPGKLDLSQFSKTLSGLLTRKKIYNPDTPVDVGITNDSLYSAKVSGKKY